MRSTCRLFLAAILLVLASRVASAQVTGAASPVAAPHADALRPIPFANPDASEVVSSARVEELPPIPFAQPNPTAASKPVTKKTKKPAKKPTVTVSESFKSDAPLAAAVAAAAVDTTADTPPPDAGVKPALVDSASETRPDATEKMSIGGWILYGVLVAFLFGVVTLIRSRLTLRSTAVARVDFTAPIPELKPALAPRS
jgi:hypothetical protein